MKCDACGKFRSQMRRLPVTQADYLFGDADPRYICAACDSTSINLINQEGTK